MHPWTVLYLQIPPAAGFLFSSLLFLPLLFYTLGLALIKNLLFSAGGKPHYTQGTLLPPWPGASLAAACRSVFLPRQSGEAQTLLAARRSGFGAPPWSQSCLSSRELRALWHSPRPSSELPLMGNSQMWGLSEAAKLLPLFVGVSTLGFLQVARFTQQDDLGW